MSKIAFDQVVSTFTAKGYKFLDQDYKNARWPHNAEHMSCGYKWKISFDNLSHGRGCPKCSGHAKYTLQEITKFYEEKNLKLLSDVFENLRTKYNTLCNRCGHVWLVNAMSLKASKYGCPNCAGNLPISLEKALAIYKKHDIELLEPELYKNASTKTKLKCLICGYTWHLRLVNLSDKTRGCAKCGGVAAYTTEEVIKFYDEKNINFLSEEYINATTKYKLECRTCSYKWDGLLFVLFASKAGCPKCAGTILVSYEEACARYLEKNIKLLSPEIISAKQSLNLECLICNVQWSAAWDSFNSAKQACPVCNKRKNEKITLKILNHIFPGKNIKYFRLKSEKLAVKKFIIVDAEFKIGAQQVFVEYQGAQHYKPVSFNGDIDLAIKNFEIQKKRDEWLRRYCKENNIILIEIDGREYTDEKIEIYLKEELTRLGLL